MFSFPGSDPKPIHLDLSTLRETLAYMHDDMCRTPGLEKLRDALALALKEAEAAEATTRPAKVRFSAARFLPRRY
ncbi:MAG: hypothetical protein KDJ18_03630 [Hyphomicrobiaceae bacterium]|nr:hypothetical protein [Hyphomicrobiaceae bacterium]